MSEESKEVAVKEDATRSLLASAKIENGNLVLTSGDQLWWLANRVIMGGLAPKGMGNASSVFLAMIAGMEVGLNPMQSMQGIMVVNNRTTMWGDVAFAKCLASPLCLGIREWIEGEGEGAVAHCECVRKGWPEPVHRTFSWAWAKKADLHTKETYQKYPLRMIQMRARAFALRDAFADVLKGMGIAEEAMDFVDVTAAEVAPQPSAKAKTLDQVTEQLEGERAGAGRGRPAGSKNRPKPSSCDARIVPSQRLFVAPLFIGQY